MKILTTGADVDKVGDRWTVIYEGYLVGMFDFKEDALQVALDAVKLSELIPESHTKNFFKNTRRP